jgi:hypothetical protein
LVHRLVNSSYLKAIYYSVFPKRSILLTSPPAN